MGILVDVDDLGQRAFFLAVWLCNWLIDKANREYGIQYLHLWKALKMHTGRGLEHMESGGDILIWIKN